jgi:hypothetical protein
MKKLVFFSLMTIFLIGCDAKPIDYSKHTRKSSYARAGSTQTGSLRKAHARKGVSTSKRAFKNRLNSKSYYNRNRHRRKLKKGN